LTADYGLFPHVGDAGSFGQPFDWPLLQHPHRFLNCAFELRIFAGDHFFRPVLDIDIRANAFISRPPICHRA
jgi:hypothetical protein